MLESLDEKLQKGTDWVKVVFDQVDYRHAILFVILNGVLISAATTGYLEENSIKPWSLAGGLYFLNFFMMLLILTIKISPTTRFLTKVIAMAILGYAAFWQYGAQFTEVKEFTPLAEHPFMIFLFSALLLGAAIWAFNGNDELERDSKIDYAEYEEMKRKLALYETDTVPASEAGTSQASQYS